ncbi:MAG: hypothetical protein CME06_12480 [Gemmatimonadetes bacterium]|nr:hypothetical protein [Gemmatimonadota bacterium]
MATQETGQTRHELTKLLIRLNRLNFRLDQHLTGEEIRHLQDERRRLNAELFKVSVDLRGEHSLSETELDELRGRGAEGEQLLNFLIRSMSQRKEPIDREAGIAQERALKQKRGDIESQLSAIASARQPTRRLSPDEIADLRKERDGLRTEVEELMENRDFYREQVEEMRNLARRGKSKRIHEALTRIERHTKELPATETLRLIADLLSADEPISATRARALAAQSTNDVFLQMLLAHHESLTDEEGGEIRAMLESILANPATFGADLLDDTVSFFRSKTFRRHRSLHSIVLFNPGAPVHLLRHILRVPLKDLEQATERAKQNYGSSDILDVLTEIARTSTDRNRLRHILQITAVDPVRRIRFERVLASRDDIGDAGVLKLKPNRTP